MDALWEGMVTKWMSCLLLKDAIGYEGVALSRNNSVLVMVGNRDPLGWPEIKRTHCP